MSDQKRNSLQGSDGPVNLKWLRARRKARGLTMQQVADAAGLTVGFISQIERGIATPSLSSLVSVAHVLDVPVSEIFQQPAVTGSETHKSERQIYAVGENAATYERLSSSFPGSLLRSVIVHEPPGHRSEPISHEGEELFFLLEGSMTVEVNGRTTVLEAGDSMHFSSTKVHSTWNHTDRPATMLWAGTMDIFGDESPLAHAPVKAGIRMTRHEKMKP